MKDILFQCNGKTPNIAQVADGLGDSNVINNGTANAFGIDMEPVMAEIFRSNATKFWSYDEINATFSFPVWSKDFNARLKDNSEFDHKIRSVGNNRYIVFNKDDKVIKPPSYSPANIEKIIEQQKSSTDKTMELPWPEGKQQMQTGS